MEKYRKAVFIVIYKRENKNPKYLLLKRKLHWTGWEFPKGGVKKNENLRDAAKREIVEETGQKPINIKKYKVTGKYKYSKLLKDRPGYTGQIFSLFSAELKNKKIRLDKKEHSAYKWLDFNKAIKKLKWPNQKKCLRIVHKNLK